MSEQVQGEQRLGYFTNVYPAPSHTTMRREIQALEDLGWNVVRLAARPFNGPLPDLADVAESLRTYYVAGSVARACLSLVLLTLTRPACVISASRGALQQGIRSRSGLWKHLMYLGEAAVLVRSTRGCTHVHANFTNATSIAILARLLGGPPTSLRIHGPEEFEHFSAEDWAWRAEHAHSLIAISDYAAAQIRSRLDPSLHFKVKIVRCGVHDAALRTMCLPAGPGKEIVCVARLEERKGHQVLLRAVRALHRRGETVSLTLIGDGSLRSQLQEQARQLGLADSVRFAGWASGAQTLDAMRTASLVVLPSFAEGLPIVLMEAMAIGKPVVATRIAGIPELVEDGRTGWTVRPGDSEALADAISTVLSLPSEVLNRIAAEAQSKVRVAHTSSGTMRQLLEVIRQPTAG
jgi:colanic acid/amylovoran biosynthesis glycosyltransferase